MIRCLEADDLEHWRLLWQGYQRFYEVEIVEAASAQTWQRLLDPGEPVFGALAVEGSVPIGLVHYLYHRSTWTVGDYCYLQDLFVAPDRRGRGFGRRLIEHVYEAATRRGTSRVYWLTHESNASAMQLYDRIGERSGFVQYRKLLGR